MAEASISDSGNHNVARKDRAIHKYRTALIAFALVCIGSCAPNISSCSSQCGAYLNPCTGGPIPSLSPSPSHQTLILMNLTNVAVTDPTYGTIFGYSVGSTGAAQILHLTANSQVQFVAVDTSHTASFLGAATASSAPWPANCAAVAACVSTTASAAGTSINTAGFTTGIVTPGIGSALYLAPTPGFYMIGCHFHYDSNGMRTVIISM